MIYLGDATQLSELRLISTKERDQGDCQISNMIEKRFTGSKLKINPETDRVQIQLHLIVAMNPSYAHETLLSSLRIFTYYPIEELDAMNMMHPNQQGEAPLRAFIIGGQERKESFLIRIPLLVNTSLSSFVSIRLSKCKD